jgi:hypothetical protein
VKQVTCAPLKDMLMNLPTINRLLRPDRDKHPCLSQTLLNYSSKIVYNMGHITDVISSFFVIKQYYCGN